MSGVWSTLAGFWFSRSQSARANACQPPSRCTIFRSPSSAGSLVPALVMARMPVLDVLYCADEEARGVAVDRREVVVAGAGGHVDDGVLARAGSDGRGAADGDAALRLLILQERVLARVDGEPARDRERIDRVGVGGCRGLRIDCSCHDGPGGRKQRGGETGDPSAQT